LQATLSLGMDHRFVIHTPLMWRDKAETWALAPKLGGAALVALIVEETHSCYLGLRPVPGLRASGRQRQQPAGNSRQIDRTK
jgi:7-cyano-7-deazaguanine synthase in queuosine biosynthesis